LFSAELAEKFAEVVKHFHTILKHHEHGYVEIKSKEIYDKNSEIIVQLNKCRIGSNPWQFIEEMWVATDQIEHKILRKKKDRRREEILETIHNVSEKCGFETITNYFLLVKKF
jgi:hypothetical protein